MTFGHRVSAWANVGMYHQDDRWQDPCHPDLGVLTTAFSGA